MITHYYVNGKAVSADDFVDADVLQINQHIIGELNQLVREKAIEYYDKRPNERPKPDPKVVYKEFNGYLIDAYCETEEGKHLIDDFLKKHPFTTKEKEVRKNFWFYAIIIGVCILLLILASL